MTLCDRALEVDAIKLECRTMERKLDTIITSQHKMNTSLAVIVDNNKNTGRVLERFGNKLDGHDSRIRDIEEAVRENTKIRNTVQTWLERVGMAGVAGYLGWEKFGGG